MHSSIFDEVCLTTSVAKVRKNSYSDLAENTSINTVFKSLLSISAVTFFTKDVFPQRRGEISIVLIP